MAHDATDGETTNRGPETTRSTFRTWVVLALVLGSLVGLPVLVLAETELGLLSGAGLPRRLTLGVLALVPGFALGGLSLVVMTGWE